MWLPDRRDYSGINGMKNSFPQPKANGRDRRQPTDAALEAPSISLIG